MSITITPAMWMLIDLLISNAIKVAINEISQLTPDQVSARLIVEEARKKELTKQLYGD